MKKLLMTVVLFVFALSLGARAADSGDSAEAFVEQQAQTLLAHLNSDPKRYENDPEAFSTLIRKEVFPYMDFNKMAQIVIGANWKRFSPTQKEAFTNAFRDLLVRQYSRGWTQYAHSQINMLGNTGLDKFGRTDVRVQVKPPHKPAANIVFSLWKKDGVWKIYNVSFENVSIVLTYRSSFASDLDKLGIDGLIAKVQQMDGNE